MAPAAKTPGQTLHVPNCHRHGDEQRILSVRAASGRDSPPPGVMGHPIGVASATMGRMLVVMSGLPGTGKSAMLTRSAASSAHLCSPSIQLKRQSGGAVSRRHSKQASPPTRSRPCWQSTALALPHRDRRFGQFSWGGP